MILREATILYKGYDPDDLTPKSHKRICVSCDKCGRVKWIPYQSYNKAKYSNLCFTCVQKKINRLSKNNSNWKGGKITIKCDYCGELKDIYFSNKHDHNFCNQKCHYKWNSENLVRESSSQYNLNITDDERIIGRFYPKYKEWRKDVYKRDNYICQKCGQHGGDLNAHHIESYAANPDTRTTLSNGVTLCEDCHKDFHHQYGKGNNNREQFSKFMGGLN